MSKNKLFVVFFLLMGCTSLKDMEVVKYPSTKDPKYYINVPEGFTFSGITGDHEVEHKYVYPDSSMLFVTNFTNTPNYEILRKDSLYYDKFNANVLSEDTLILSGVTNEGYWKDITYGKISIGYQKVPEEKKESFDQALETFRSKRR